jgi:hypothetical protein
MSGTGRGVYTVNLQSFKEGGNNVERKQRAGLQMV